MSDEGLCSNFAMETASLPTWSGIINKRWLCAAGNRCTIIFVSFRGEAFQKAGETGVSTGQAGGAQPGLVLAWIQETGLLPRAGVGCIPHKVRVTRVCVFQLVCLQSLLFLLGYNPILLESSLTRCRGLHAARMVTWPRLPTWTDSGT